MATIQRGNREVSESERFREVVEVADRMSGNVMSGKREREGGRERARSEVGRKTGSLKKVGLKVNERSETNWSLMTGRECE